jgi:hypothetical protein
MTMPNERRWAVNNTRQFLVDLMDPKKTPRVPKEIREANTNRFKFRVTQEMREYPPEIYEFLPDCHAINDLVEELCFDM